MALNNHLDELRDILGKTIKATLIDGDELYLGFTDGTFCIVESAYSDGGFGGYDRPMKVSESAWACDENLVKIGALSHAEWHENLETQAKLDKIQDDMQKLKREAETKDRELAQLQALKEKYENEREENTRVADTNRPTGFWEKYFGKGTA